jgi:tetraacyldisaccharide 4'-kinase
VLVHKALGDATAPDWLEWSGPIAHAALTPKNAAPKGPLIAFAGIGRPLKFFDGLKAAGGDVMDGVAFADHHDFTKREMDDLRLLAESYDARLITTEKDFVRLPLALREGVAPFPVEATFADDTPLRDALLRVTAKR